nr:uncharacterized protein LOC110077467 [Pogona vitticeps]
MGAPFRVGQGAAGARTSRGDELWEQSAARLPSTDGPSLSSSAATPVQDFSCEGKATRAPIKTPLQAAEAKYKAGKEEQCKGEGSDPKASSQATKNGLAGCDGGNCPPKKEVEGVVESCQQENTNVLPGRQDCSLLLGCQTSLANQESQRKPYLSAKSHANILRKGATTTHASSSKAECIGVPGAFGCKDHQTTRPNIEEEKSEVTLSTSFQSKQFFKGHECVNSKGLEDPGTKTEQNAEKEKPLVVMREKPCRETEDERLKRLSVHKEEIMKGNVKEAMEIFENLRKQEALQEILTRVKEFEEETSKVDVKALRSLFEDVPDWVGHHNVHQTKHPKLEKPEQMREVKEETDSVSSVELAFEDLESTTLDMQMIPL